MMNHVAAARAMKKVETTRPLKELIGDSISQYNQKNKRARAFQITPELKKMILALTRCPASVVDRLQNHYMMYRHSESGGVHAVSVTQCAAVEPAMHNVHVAFHTDCFCVWPAVGLHNLHFDDWTPGSSRFKGDPTSNPLWSEILTVRDSTPDVFFAKVISTFERVVSTKASVRAKKNAQPDTKQLSEMCDLSCFHEWLTATPCRVRSVLDETQLAHYEEMWVSGSASEACSSVFQGNATFLLCCALLPPSNSEMGGLEVWFVVDC